MTWFDSHCHIDDERWTGGADAVLDAARSAGVGGFITVGTDGASSRAAIELAARHDDVWATVGLHPHDASAGVSTIINLFDEPRVVAIGECGLDYHYDYSPRSAQREAFAAQIALALERRLPLVIHTREAWSDTFAILASVGVPERTIFHCFTGGPDEASTCLDLDAFLSFSGIVTFPSAADVQAAAVLCPSDRLLIETDSPYLAPVPFRGRRNEPAYLPAVGEKLSVLRGVSPDEVADCSFVNARVAFALADS